MTESSNEPEAFVYIIDASVVLKWTLKSEELADKALEVLSSYLAGNVALYAPTNILHEVPGALKTAVSRKRLSYEDAEEAIVAFYDLGLTTVGSRELTLRAFSLAHERMLSFYDCLYLALAEASGYPLLYADSRITPALSGIPNCFLANYLHP